MPIKIKADEHRTVNMRSIPY